MDEVVFAKPGDLKLLGARTLEGFNALVDRRRKRLVAARPMPAASGAAAVALYLPDLFAGFLRSTIASLPRPSAPRIR